MDASDAYVRVQFPCGTTYMVRVEDSGVVLDEANKPISEELAFDMLLIKGQKLARCEVGGHA